MKSITNELLKLNLLIALLRFYCSIYLGSLGKFVQINFSKFCLLNKHCVDPNPYACIFIRNIDQMKMFNYSITTFFV